MAANNEGRCLDAVLRILEKKLSATRHIIERDTPARRGIELVCMIGTARYAFEHTIIEPFPGTVKDDVDFGRVFDDGFEEAVRDRLTNDLAYNLDVNVYAFSGMNGQALISARASLIAWTSEVAPRLPTPTSHRQSTIHAGPPEVVVPVRLARNHSKGLGGRLMVGRFAPEPLEELRRARLLKALNNKTPKLHTAGRSGARTVLILENRDIALTNEGLVSELLDTLGHQLAHMPDDVYLVGPYSKNRFYVTQIRRDGKHAWNCWKAGTSMLPRWTIFSSPRALTRDRRNFDL